MTKLAFGTVFTDARYRTGTSRIFLYAGCNHKSEALLLGLPRPYETTPDIWAVMSYDMYPLDIVSKAHDVHRAGLSTVLWSLSFMQQERDQRFHPLFFGRY